MKEETSPAHKRIWESDFKGCKTSHPLLMKCLLCSKKKLNPGSMECSAYERKPDSILYDNADCPSFERCIDAEGLRWIEGYVKLSGKAYVPRQDDIPPAGWEKSTRSMRNEEREDREEGKCFQV